MAAFSHDNSSCDLDLSWNIISDTPDSIGFTFRFNGTDDLSELYDCKCVATIYLNSLEEDKLYCWLQPICQDILSCHIFLECKLLWDIFANTLLNKCDFPMFRTTAHSTMSCLRFEYGISYECLKRISGIIFCMIPANERIFLAGRIQKTISVIHWKINHNVILGPMRDLRVFVPNPTLPPPVTSVPPSVLDFCSCDNFTNNFLDLFLFGRIDVTDL